jgi:hypothetical protein
MAFPAMGCCDSEAAITAPAPTATVKAAAQAAFLSHSNQTLRGGSETFMGAERQDASGAQPQGFAGTTASAASTISRLTSFGREIMTTCEAPLTTTVFIDFARSAMKASAAAGMFLSRSP